MLSGCADVSEPVNDVPAVEDSDGDGYIDAIEHKFGSDPHNATSIPDIMVHEEVAFSDSGLIVAGNEGILIGTCGMQGTIDTAHFEWDIQAPEGARKVHVTDLVFTASLPATMLELDIYVFDPEGNDITPGTTTMTIPPQRTDTIAIEGKHPAGTYTIEVRGCLGSGEVDLDASGLLGYEPDVESLLAEPVASAEA